MSAEDGNFAAPEPVPNPADVEKLEEEKLKAKYSFAGAGAPGGPGRPGGHSAFLQKRLQKGVSIFINVFKKLVKRKKPCILCFL